MVTSPFKLSVIFITFIIIKTIFPNAILTHTQEYKETDEERKRLRSLLEGMEETKTQWADRLQEIKVVPTHFHFFCIYLE